MVPIIRTARPPQQQQQLTKTNTTQFLNKTNKNELQLKPNSKKLVKRMPF